MSPLGTKLPFATVQNYVAFWGTAVEECLL
jgi:hypothetical protein